MNDSQLKQINKKTSISLPDMEFIRFDQNSNNIKANLRQPTTPAQKSNINLAKKGACSSTPSKTKKSSTLQNISIILEEKENPNAPRYNTRTKKSSKQRVEIASKVDNGTQCNLSEEAMLYSEAGQEGTLYWKLLCMKRLEAIDETKDENKNVN
jgi:hypothetical protein